MVLRRLVRLCARYATGDSAGPTVIFASATASSPAATASELLGQAVAEVTEDGSPQGGRTVALWEPALRTDLLGENGAPVRRSAGAEAARVMADLMAEGARTLTFVRSRRGAELTALGARARLEDVAPELVDLVASYRAGYLAEDRRELESALADGRLRGLATTNALELGVDIAGLDAVVLAGFPGTVASFWQQAGRAGRRGQSALIVMIARDDPLDTYLVNHPAALLGKPLERVVIDPTNPFVLGPQLLCAATELPLTEAEVRMWNAEAVAESLVDDGLLRRQARRVLPDPGHRSPSRRRHPRLGGRTDRDRRNRNRSTAGQCGRRPGSGVGAPRRGLPAPRRELRGRFARLRGRASPSCTPTDPGYTTSARELTDISVSGSRRTHVVGRVTTGVVPVSVSHTVIGYLRRRFNGEVIDFVELDMPTQTLDTVAVMCTITPEALQDNGIEPRSCSRGRCTPPSTRRSACCPLVASCDRGDIGGVSMAIGPDGLPTIFVYDGHPGVRDSRIGGFGSSPSGGRRRRQRSKRANASRAARHACSRRSAATATNHSTRRARSACYVWYSANSPTTLREPSRVDDRPLDSRHQDLRRALTRARRTLE